MSGLFTKIGTILLIAGVFFAAIGVLSIMIGFMLSDLDLF